MGHGRGHENGKQYIDKINGCIQRVNAEVIPRIRPWVGWVGFQGNDRQIGARFKGLSVCLAMERRPAWGEEEWACAWQEKIRLALDKRIFTGKLWTGSRLCLAIEQRIEIAHGNRIR